MASATIEKPATIDYAPGLEGLLFQEIPERDIHLQTISGPVPDFVRGSYYLNGPARFRQKGLQYRNWLDGDGMICALHFGQNGVRLVNRFVRGKKFVEEQAAGEPVFRAFGTSFPGDRLKRGLGTESPLNVSVFQYEGHLLAFGEQSLPVELDPVTLETRRPGKSFDFQKALNDISPFSAHPKIDPETGELFNFGIAFSSRRPCLNFYRLRSSREVVCRSRVNLDSPHSTHDFAVSQKYAVFYLSPHVLDVDGLMREGMTTIQALSWEPDRGSQLLVLCRDTGREVARIAIPGRYCLHTINAFDEGGRLLVDVLELDRPVYDQYQDLPDMFLDVPRGRPVRFELDVQNGRVVSRREIEYSRAPDFPAIDPRREMKRCEELWTLGISSTGQPGRKFFDQLAHLSWQEPQQADIYRAPAGQYFGGEPVFVPDPDTEGGGIIVCHLADATTASSTFQLFDASHVAAGPIAVLDAGGPMHLGFHATFVSA